MPSPLVPLLLGGGVIATMLVLNNRAKGGQGTVPPTSEPTAGAVPSFGPGNLPPLPALAVTNTIADVAKALGIPSNGVPPGPGKRIPSMQDLINRLQSPDPQAFMDANPDVDWATVTTDQTHAAFNALTAQQPSLAQGTGMQAGTGISTLDVSNGQHAVVTTSDPAPAGDLIVRSSADINAPQVGGVDKGGTVSVIDATDMVWASIQWAGGRWPACSGFVRKSFLRPIL